MNEWIHNLQAGDFVIVKGQGEHLTGAFESRVIRTTKARVYVMHPHAEVTEALCFRKANGLMTPSHVVGMHPQATLVQKTPEFMREMEVAKARVELRAIHWPDVPDRELMTIIGIVRGIR